MNRWHQNKTPVGSTTEPEGLSVHLQLFPRKARVLPQVLDLNPQRRGKAHQVRPGLSQDAYGRPLGATVSQPREPKEQGLALPTRVDV